ncbi:lysoplasmalogenase [Streptomyces sp. NPDC005925]|uniref:lysoplasmalogenase n=1 Tax=Streptomyces sp. NPDC005925 TaxID=3157172 RepID=UPI0033CDE191
MKPTRGLLAAFAFAAAVDLVSLLAGPDTGHTIAKPFLMPLLAAWAAVSGAPRLLVAALLFGWGGDTLLLFDADPAFLAGMGCFAAGHVCYLTLFARRGRNSPSPHTRARLLVIGYGVALAALLVLLRPDLPAGLRVPVAVYSALLTSMACAAAVRVGAVAGLGGALFLLSDTLIATGIADWPQLPRADFWVMLTYLAGQALLAAGVLAAGGPRPAPAAASGAAA